MICEYSIFQTILMAKFFQNDTKQGFSNLSGFSIAPD